MVTKSRVWFWGLLFKIVYVKFVLVDVLSISCTVFQTILKPGIHLRRSETNQMVENIIVKVVLKLFDSKLVAWKTEGILPPKLSGQSSTCMTLFKSFLGFGWLISWELFVNFVVSAIDSGSIESIHQGHFKNYRTGKNFCQWFSGFFKIFVEPCGKSQIELANFNWSGIRLLPGEIGFLDQWIPSLGQ